MELEYLGLSGHAVGVPEKAAIACSFALLQQKYRKPVHFWGRVEGYQGDYLVAQVEGETIVAPRTTLYSVDGGNTWTAIDTPTEEQIEFCEQIRGPFMGDVTFSYKIEKELPPEEEAPVPAPELPKGDAEEEEEQVEAAEPEEEAAEEAQEEALGEEEGDETAKPVKRRPKTQVIAMKETARLAHFVAKHDAACRIVPRGAYIQHPSSSAVIQNQTFQGLDVVSCTRLENYFRTEKSEDAAENQQIFGGQYSATTDFLHNISTVMPKGVWNTKYDALLGCVVVQNLLYTGSTFFHKPNTKVFGQYYVGDGTLNVDLCFMLP